MIQPRSANGTIEEVAAFFRVSVRTIHEWKAANPPKIGNWSMGRNVSFGEDDVVAVWVRHHRRGSAGRPGDGEAMARTLWRRHLELVRADEILPRLDEVVKRLQVLEKRAGTRPPKDEDYFWSDLAAGHGELQA